MTHITPFEVVTIVLILLGAGIMFFATDWIRKILRIDTERPSIRSWGFLFGLTILFLVGYIASIVLILLGESNYLLLAAGIIFLSGAAFVYFVGQVSFFTIEGYQITSDKLRKTTDELKIERAHLEDQVSMRTTALETHSQQVEAVSKVSQKISQILVTADLLLEITNLISYDFGYHHVAIYTVDPDNMDFAYLRAANSDAGKFLMSQEFRVSLHGDDAFSNAGKNRNLTVSKNLVNPQEFRPQANPILKETTYQIAIPLQSGENLIGILDIQTDRPEYPSNEELSILNTLAGLASVSLQNAQSFDHLQNALANAEKGYRQVFQQGWQQISAKQQNPGFRYSQKNVTRIEDPGEIDSLKNKASGEEEVTIASRKKTPVINLPIKYGNQVIGVLNINSTSDRKQWSPDEIAIARAIADRGGQALENARLLTETQNRAARELIISEISSRISSTIQVESILQTAAEELSRALYGSEVTVQLQPGSPIPGQALPIEIAHE